MNGSLTGYGADVIIIDDPQKAQEILSDKKRKASNEIFSNTIISRLNNKVEGKIIVVAQRLHTDDFTNYVQKHETWDLLAIPAIAEKDETYILSDNTTIERRVNEVVNQKLEPLDKLIKLREGMGEFGFSAQYQQNPIPIKGNLINFYDFKFFKKEHINEEAIIIQSWDVAVKTGEKNDYSVCVTAAICNNMTHIIDISRYKCDFISLLQQVKEMKNKYYAQGIIIEDVGIGNPLIQTLENDGIDIIPYKPTLSKQIRAVGITPHILLGDVRLLHKADWLDDFKAEVLAFPFGQHDDQVDAFVQLISVVKNNDFRTSQVPISDMFDGDFTDDYEELWKFACNDQIYLE